MTRQYTLEEQKAFRAEWVAALRSGEYWQARGCLKDGDGYCCLGVAAKLAGTPDEKLEGVGILAHLPYVMERLGLRYSDGAFWPLDRTLANLNDRGVSFAEIADIIESEPKGLFRESVISNG